MWQWLLLAAEFDEPETLEEGGDNSVCLKTRGVSYHTASRRWIARWRENGKQREKGFLVKRYRTEGMSFADASRLAQEAAVKHRKALEQSGKCGFRLFDLAAGVDGPTALEENGDMLKKQA